MQLKTVTLATLLASSVFAMPGHAGVFVPNSLFTVSGTNTPGNVSALAVITDGLAQSLITSDARLMLTVQETSDGAGGEWIGFHYSSSPTLVRNSQTTWNLSEVGLQTNTATNFVGSFLSFDLNGVVQAQTNCGGVWGSLFVNGSDISGQGGGAGCLATGFVDPFPAGALPSLGTTTGSSSFDTIMADVGIFGLAGSLTSYTEILDFRPQQVIPPTVPEPASLGLFGFALLGLGAVARYTRTR